VQGEKIFNAARSFACFLKNIFSKNQKLKNGHFSGIWNTTFGTKIAFLQKSKMFLCQKWYFWNTTFGTKIAFYKKQRCFCAKSGTVSKVAFWNTTFGTFRKQES
jgi:hypothetical protein